MKIIIYRTSLIFCMLTALSSAKAQWTTMLPLGKCVSDLTDNRLLFYGKSEKTYDSLFYSLNELILKGKGTVKILHIGDSHIQAGFIPEQMRKNFSSFIAPGCGARGLIFPYRIAKTNNPADYVVKFTGKWESCRNVELTKNCSLGLMGIMVRTRDTLSEVIFHFKETSTFREFRSIRLFHDPLDTSFRIDFPGLAGTYKVVLPIHSGYTDVRFDTVISDSLRIRIIRKDTTGKYFTFYGIDFENEDAGIVYSASGVNGAEVSSYLRCNLITDQLKVMKPGWIIISLGTNEAYSPHFDKEQYIRNYINLVREIREVAPGVPVLLTVPGDSYRRRRYDNANLPVARAAIFEVAKQTDCAVWDFYTLMGGPKSILTWYKAGLVAKDKLHFDKRGYTIQADMLFDAFVNAWTSFIDQTTSPE